MAYGHAERNLALLRQLEAETRQLLASLDLSAVKAVTIGSAPLTEALVARVQEMFPQAAISNGYGTTEAGPSIFEDHPQGLPRPLLSLGYPLPDVEVRLVGGTGEEGVLEVRSPAMFTEYLNLPHVTGAKLRDGWYEVNQAGSHKQFKHPVKKGRVTLPHPKREIPIGTLKSIEKQAGIKLR